MFTGTDEKLVLNSSLNRTIIFYVNIYIYATYYVTN